MRKTLSLVAVLIALWAGGLIWFVRHLPPESVAAPRADGIIALTGGSERLAAAVRLLESGRGARLLITGVNENTGRKALQNTLQRSNELFDCCIDLGYDARDTMGNARESRAWADDAGFGSLIIVTSVYHLPRTRLEFSRLMPDRALYYYGVRPNNAELDGWWYRPRSFSLLAWEYTKYLLTRARLSLFGV